MNDAYNKYIKAGTIRMADLFHFERLIIFHHVENFKLVAALRAFFDMIREQQTDINEGMVGLVYRRRKFYAKYCISCAISVELSIIRFVKKNIRDDLCIRHDIIEYIMEQYSKRDGFILSPVCIVDFNYKSKFISTLSNAMRLFFEGEFDSECIIENELKKVDYMQRVIKLMKNHNQSE